MDNYNINQSLINGDTQTPGVLPHVDNLQNASFIFEQDFGLPVLPCEPGIIFIRGPRQYGKSTWLEQQIVQTITQFGKGTALYLNGDEIRDNKALFDEIASLITLFSSQSNVKRLFIDEITAIADWQRSIKRLVDSGKLRDILLITTGSKASDLRHGIERLPGRKGKLARTNYIFTPLSYIEFKNKCAHIFKDDLLYAYILSGGSPVGANALAQTGILPEYVISIINDWVYGEFAAKGRSRSHLMAVLQSIYRTAGSPVGQAKLARESGLSNNTVAQGYIDLLNDLMIISPMYPYDPEKKITFFRKPCKFQFINLLAAICWHPQKPRSIAEFKAMGKSFGCIYEWVVAQEIWRRQCLENLEGIPDHLYFWQSNEHEIDFILPEENQHIEVKSGQSSALEFMWYGKCFKKSVLTVVNKGRFDSQNVHGITLEDFLMLG